MSARILYGAALGKTIREEVAADTAALVRRGIVPGLAVVLVIVHASFIVNKSIEATQDIMVGSGKLFNVLDFVKDLYYRFNMNYTDFVENNKMDDPHVKEKLIMANVNWQYTYQDLLNHTYHDIINYMEKNGYSR